MVYLHQVRTVNVPDLGDSGIAATTFPTVGQFLAKRETARKGKALPGFILIIP
jgi:hypothetical protein